MKTALERFLKYIAIETTSCEESGESPSTKCQFDLARILVDELLELGLSDAKVDEHCYVTATLPTNIVSNDSKPVPTIGFIAHLDTSCAVSGKNIKASVIDYVGGDIVLENGIKVPETEGMKKLIGDRLVITDGTTLLGADDKAGISAIMTATERLIVSNVKRPNIRICFTPDEEIGAGTAFFDVKRFDADCAYTIDGGAAGEINGETFTADKAVLVVKGVDVHPGEAKDVMVNATRIVAQIIASLPLVRTPEQTEGREPFIHLYKMGGGVSFAKAEFLLRAFCEEDREENRRILQKAVATFSSLKDCQIELVFEQQYLNMGLFFDRSSDVLKLLERAVRNVGLVPNWVPIRGGTDGSRLTEMGLPTPNIFTGGRNFHSVMEFLDVEENEKAVETLVELACLWADK